MSFYTGLTRSRALAAIFLLDGVLALGFGIISLATPRGTFGTIVDLGNASDESIIFATLASLSGFYVLVGLLSILVAFLPSPYKERFVLPMIVSHGWMGLKGFQEIGREWLIGNPWPDTIIHSTFICAYVLVTAAGFLHGRIGRGRV